MKTDSHSSELITLQVDGMTCTNCAAGIEKSLKNKGLHKVDVSFQNGEVSFEPITALPLDKVKSEIEKLGYKVRKEEQNSPEGKFTPLEIRFAISAILTLPLLAHMFSHNALLNHPFFQLAMSLPVMFIGWSFFGKSAWHSLKNRVPNMDVLISIGSTSAFFYSLWGTWLYYGTAQVHDFMFYETAATIITLVLLGNVLEHRSLRQTGSALRELAALQPDSAKRVSFDGVKKRIQEIKASEVLQNDIIVADTGERIAADGLIISQGEAYVDEAMITGESLPVQKTIGDRVTGGTLVVSGAIEFQATHIGKESALARIIELVKKTQGEKPAIQRLGDRVSAVFVPVVIGIALLTFLGAYFIFSLSAQQALMNAVAVLVISCPCAMGLATPTAVSVGLGRAAKRGILIKGGPTIESFANVQKMVFDKTGTLTTGEFHLRKLHILQQGLDEQDIKAHILALAERSSHPISVSLKNALAAQVSPSDLFALRELKGKGMTGKDQQNQMISLGSARILNHIPSQNFNLYLAINGEAVAGLHIEDEVKQGAKEMIAAFHQQGIESIMLSGDKKERCDAIAADLGINTVYSEQLPEQKLEIIRTLAAEGNIAMVGDGVNDAPALSLAQTGISPGDATQVAVNAAQVVLLNKDNLDSLTEAWKLSKLTLRTIKQNLFWAFFYNVLAIPLAAMGYLSPMIAAFSMAFSDIIVIGNSIWLKRKRYQN